jgi:hypothetical protein
LLALLTEQYEYIPMSGALALAVYGGLLALLALGVLLRPPTAFAAVSCIYGLKQWGQSTNDWLASHPPATNIAVGVLVLCAIVTAAARGRCVLCNIPRITWLVFGLLLYSLASLLWTPRPDIAGLIWVQSYPYLLTFVVLVPLVVNDLEDFRTALSWLLVVGGLLVVVLLVFGHWGLRGLSLGTHSIEEETNPLALAGLGGSIAVTALLLRPRRMVLTAWLLRLAVVGASLLLIVRSESRGQLVAVLAAMLMMLPLAVRLTSLRGFVAATVGSLVVVLALSFGFSRFIGVQDADRWSQSTGSSDAGVRFQMVDKLLELWSQSGTSVVFGLGNSASWDPDINGIYPHDVPLETLGEEGVLGFALYATIVLCAIGALIRAAVATTGREDDRSIVAAAGGGFLFFLFVSLKQGNMIGSVEFFMYAMLLARLARSLTLPQPVDSRPPVAPEMPLPVFPNLLR